MHSSWLLVLTKIDIFVAVLAHSLVVVAIFQGFHGILRTSKYMLSTGTRC